MTITQAPPTGISTRPGSPQPAGPVVVGRSTTLSRLGALTAVTVLILALLFAALAVATGSARQALRIIGHDAGPQVVATTDLYFALSDADAQVANALLLGAAQPDRRATALRDYDQRRAEIAAALLLAYRLAGDSPTEQRTVQAILDGFGRYEQLAARAILLAEQAEYPPGAPPEPVLAAYRQATDLMSFQVLPQAYNLTLENGTKVRQTYDDARATVLAGRTTVAVGGLLAIGCLVWLQLHLVRRFRRVFNPALLVATAVTAMYTFTGVAVLSTEAKSLHTAKTAGFDAVLSLARARVVSNSMHADQIRYLIDPGRADTYEQIYLDKAQSLVYLEAGNLAAYRDGVADLADSADRPATPGLLGVFAGGAASGTAGSTLSAYHQLQQADRQLRRPAGDPSGGSGVASVGEVEEAFDEYDDALVALTAQYRSTFDTAIADGEDALADLGFLLPTAMISIAVLVVAGVAPRLNEYR